MRQTESGKVGRHHKKIIDTIYLFCLSDIGTINAGINGQCS